MPVQHLEEDTKVGTDELKKLTSYAKKIKLPRQYLTQMVPKLSKLELMVLDSAFKDLDLIKLRTTILVLEEPYLDMLQNVIDCLILTVSDFLATR